MRKRSKRHRNLSIAGRFDRQNALLISTGLFIACCITLGGGVFRPSAGIVAIAVTGTFLLATTFSCASVPRDLPRTAIVLLVLLVLLPAVQLVPLPPILWSALPGRQLPAEATMATTGSLAWRPITLSVTGTCGALLCLAWLVALLVSVLSLNERNVRRLILLIVYLGVASLAAGTVQFMSHGEILNFYNNSSRELLLGFFANKNHSGLFLACLLLIGFALAPQGKMMRREAMAWMVPAALIVMVAIIATYSRAALLLGGLSLAMIAVMIRAETKQTNGKLLLWIAGTGVLIVAMLSTSLGEQAISRFGMVGNDLRWLFWKGSWPLAKNYFPTGAGFGTFQNLFAANEHLEWVKPTYVNNAHNDYLEAVIEAGVPAIILIGLVFVIIAQAAPIAWRDRRTLKGRWALCGLGIIILFAAHSFGDYPLRRLGPAAVFFFALTLLLRIFTRGEEALSPSEDGHRALARTVPPQSGS